MKKSTKELLTDTFASIPNKFSYREVRFHVYHALRKLQDLEKREAVKERAEIEQRIKEEEKKKHAPWMPPIYQEGYNIKPTIDMIDKLIADEQKKIEEIRNKQSQGVRPEEKELEDDDGEQAIHG